MLISVSILAIKDGYLTSDELKKHDASIDRREEAFFAVASLLNVQSGPDDINGSARTSNERSPSKVHRCTMASQVGEPTGKRKSSMDYFTQQKNSSVPGETTRNKRGVEGKIRETAVGLQEHRITRTNPCY